MRTQISIIALLFTPCDSLRLFGVNVAASGGLSTPIVRSTGKIDGSTRSDHVKILPPNALGKVHKVARGGAGKDGIMKSLKYAAAFPVVQWLPLQPEGGNRVEERAAEEGPVVSKEMIYIPPDGPGSSPSGNNRFAAMHKARTALVANTIGFSLLEVSGKRGSILTASGALNAWILGVLLWWTLGRWGWATCVLYLFAGSAVTRVRMDKKKAMGIAEGRGGARGPENVWGSAATGAMCALASLSFPQWAAPLKIGYVASLATKLSDTFASEIGKAYGKRTFLITTLKPVPPGTEGAVSLEGTLAGVVGSIVIAGFAAFFGVVGLGALPACLIAAFVATNFESVLGATTQGKLPWLTNEVVNFVNTLVGAGVGIALGLALKV